MIRDDPCAAWKAASAALGEFWSERPSDVASGKAAAGKVTRTRQASVAYCARPAGRLKAAGPARHALTNQKKMLNVQLVEFGRSKGTGHVQRL